MLPAENVLVNATSEARSTPMMSPNVQSSQYETCLVCLKTKNLSFVFNLNARKKILIDANLNRQDEEDMALLNSMLQNLDTLRSLQP